MCMLYVSSSPNTCNEDISVCICSVFLVLILVMRISVCVYVVCF